jgi:hypothetical protein
LRPVPIGVSKIDLEGRAACRRRAETEPETGPGTTVRRTSVGSYVIVKCSEELIAKPFTVANVPVSEVKFMILNVLPIVGTKPVGRLMFRIPFKLAVVGFN